MNETNVQGLNESNPAPSVASIDEGRQAKAWREAMGLTIAGLAELIGYSGAAISLFERGYGSDGRPHPEKSRRKFKMACLAVCFLRHYNMTLEDWPWQAP